MSIAEPMVLTETENDVRVESSGQEAGANRAAPAAFSSRGFTSLLLTIAFTALTFSGVIMYLTPRGRLANWSDWQMLGLAKEEWVTLHLNISILFIVVAVLHLVLNWSIFWAYLHRRTVRGVAMWKELLAAAIVSAVFVAGPILDYPPFNSIMVLNRQIKDYWERTDATTGSAALTGSGSTSSNSANAAAESPTQGADRSNLTGEFHGGGGPNGDGFGQGRGMGWGRRMGGGMGPGRGRGTGSARAIEEAVPSSDTPAPEGH